AGAAPTQLEAKAKWSDAPAEATVLERQMTMAPPAKKSPMLWIGIAAVLVVAIVVGVVMMNKKTTTTTPIATNTATTGTTLTTTTYAPPPIPGGKGVLLLSASPWGEVEKVFDKDGNREIPLTEDTRYTPAAIQLDPGTYTVTLGGPKGSKTI